MNRRARSARRRGVFGKADARTSGAALRRAGARCGCAVYALERRLLLATIFVTNTDDDGLGSLRAAIDQANSTLDRDTIIFEIPGPGVKLIQPLTPLPPITQPVVIDGYTQGDASRNTLAEGWNGRLRVRIDGARFVNQSNSAGLKSDANDVEIVGLV